MLDNVENRKKTTIIPFFEVNVAGHPPPLTISQWYTKFVYEKSGMMPL